MGMDVIGKNPRSEVGSYFGNNIWRWSSLAEYVCWVAPDIASKCTRWHSNDGDGLSEADSRMLANILQIEIDSGRTGAYPPRIAKYPLSVENVQEFANFLDACGGFEIW
jgi:hypothetical protein